MLTEIIGLCSSLPHLIGCCYEITIGVKIALAICRELLGSRNIVNMRHTANRSLMKPQSRKRVLKTGGAGFLGSHLCKRLLYDGHEVICVEKLYTGLNDNVLPLLDNPRFEIIRHDVTFPLYIEVDEIYNLACPASPITLPA